MQNTFKMQMSDQIWRQCYHGKNVPCSAIHAHSCEREALNRFIIVFKMATKLYAPIHALPVLIFKRKQLKLEPMRVFLKTLKAIMRSTTFLALYIASFWYVFCLLSRYRGKMDAWNVVGGGIVCSFAALLEPKHR